MNPGSPQVRSIGPYTLDLARGRLFLAGAEVLLRPKTYQLLTLLAENAGRVMTKEALLSGVWPGLTVTEDSLTQCVHDLRRVLHSGGAALLRTVPRRGYLLEDGGPPAQAVASDAPAAAAPEPGSLVVLPFGLPEGLAPAERRRFDGMTHDIISRLARLRAFRVIGRGSAFALRGLAGDPVRLGQLLNVSYLVTGEVLPPVPGRRGLTRVLVDLVRTRDGSLEWSDEIAVGDGDHPQAALLATDRLVAAIALAVTDAERRQALSGSGPALSAWDAFHLGIDRVYSFSAARMTEALAHFSQAIALDRGFARAHALASFCHYYFAFSGLDGNRKAGAARALAAAERALQIDDNGPSGHWSYGRALWLNGDPDGGTRHLERAVDLCPSFPQAHYMLGFIATHSGDPTMGLAHLERSEALSPFDPFLASIQITRANALLRLGDGEAAALWAARAARQKTAYPPLLRHAALVLAVAGKDAEAAAVAAQQRALDPHYDPRSLFDNFSAMPGDLRRQFDDAQTRLDR